MTAPPDATAALVRRALEAWFADPGDDRLDLPRGKRWFGGGEALDTALAREFGDAIEAAARGAHDAALRTPDGALALVVLLDQFPRNVHRGTPRAFAHDGQALAMAGLALAHGHDTRLPVVQRIFLALPFEHDESSASQERALGFLEGVTAEATARRAPDDAASGAIADFAVGALRSAREHAAIIERFGRYPHRNAALGRESTAEEQAWLADGAKGFGQ